MSSHIGQNPKKGLFTWEPFLKKCDILWTKNEKKKKKKKMKNENTCKMKFAEDLIVTHLKNV